MYTYRAPPGMSRSMGRAYMLAAYLLLGRVGGADCFQTSTKRYRLLQSSQRISKCDSTPNYESRFNWGLIAPRPIQSCFRHAFFVRQLQSAINYDVLRGSSSYCLLNQSALMMFVLKVHNIFPKVTFPPWLHPVKIRLHTVSG